MSLKVSPVRTGCHEFVTICRQGHGLEVLGRKIAVFKQRQKEQAEKRNDKKKIDVQNSTFESD